MIRLFDKLSSSHTAQGFPCSKLREEKQEKLRIKLLSPERHTKLEHLHRHRAFDFLFVFFLDFRSIPTAAARHLINAWR